jgi:aminoglycoside phosphotransferase (APT) family kinase protein
MTATEAAQCADVSDVAQWLHAANALPAGDGELTMSLIEGGQSNLTYRLLWQSSAKSGESLELVLRRPPLGGVLATAHNMSREWRFLSALYGRGVPVPRPVLISEDDSVLGAPCYVMEYVPGVILHAPADVGALDERARARATHGLTATLAALHAIDPAAVGLADIGKPENYVSRQLSRWQRQWEQTREASGLRIPEIDEAHAALTADIPVQRRSCIVHGDLRLGNVVLGPAGDVRAVLDWELATLGDPRADLGWLLLSWDHPGENRLYRPLDVAVSTEPGFGTREQVVADYQRRAGADAVERIDFFVAFAAWRWACISAGVYARYQAGFMGDRGVDLPAIERAVRSHAAFALNTISGG